MALLAAYSAVVVEWSAVAVCCSVLQSIAVCCSLLQCVAGCCSVALLVESRSLQVEYRALLVDLRVFLFVEHRFVAEYKAL